MKLTCLLLLIFLTNTCFGGDDKQPPPQTDILLSTFVTFDKLFSDILDGNAKKWEKQPVTIIAEVMEKEKHGDTVMLRFKTGVKGFICFVSSTDYPDVSAFNLLMGVRFDYKNALDKYTIGETYIFHLTIPSITRIAVFDGGSGIIFYLTEDSFTIDDPFTIEEEEFDAKSILTVITIDMLASVVEDLMKQTVQDQLWDYWNFRLTGEVKKKEADSLLLRTNDETLLFFRIDGSFNNPLDTDKYQVGEEYTFDVFRGMVSEYQDSEYQDDDGVNWKAMSFYLINPDTLKHRLSDLKHRSF